MFWFLAGVQSLHSDFKSSGKRKGTRSSISSDEAPGTLSSDIVPIHQRLEHSSKKDAASCSHSQLNFLVSPSWMSKTDIDSQGYSCLLCFEGTQNQQTVARNAKSQPEPLKHYRKQTAEAESLHFHHATVNISIAEVAEQSKDWCIIFKGVFASVCAITWNEQVTLGKQCTLDLEIL